MKNVRQELRTKMRAKMERAAEKTVSAVAKKKDYHDITGNLYKSTAVGTYFKGELQSIHYTPGPDPTRPTLAEGEEYDLPRYYSGMETRQLGRPFRGKIGEGGENGPAQAEDALLSAELDRRGRVDLTWQLKLVAGVDYASYVEIKGGHDVITSVRDYMARNFKRM